MSRQVKLISAALAYVFATNSSAQVTTTGPCAPVLSGIGGSVTINCVSVASPAATQSIATTNLNILIHRLELIISGKTTALLPALREYRDQPTAPRWAEVQSEARHILDLVRAARESVTIYNAQLKSHGDENLEISAILRSRNVILYDVLLRSTPPGRSEVEEWTRHFMSLLERTKVELKALDNAIRD
jgi:hypothetical protein